MSVLAYSWGWTKAALEKVKKWLSTLLHPFVLKDKHLFSALYNLKFPFSLPDTFLGKFESQSQKFVCHNSP